MRRMVIALAVMLGALSLSSQAAPAADSTPGHFPVRAFGATGDGKTLDTAAINRAIAAAADAGGGVVEFTAGDYLAYTIHLKSHVTLHLGPGATLIAAEPPAAGQPGGYDPPEPNAWNQFQDFGHTRFFAAAAAAGTERR